MGITVKIWRLASVFLLVLEISVSPVTAHHPGGIPGARMLVEGSQGGYKATLEITPGDLIVGSPIEFFLWVTPEGMGPSYTGEARIWVRGEETASAPPTMIPMAERDKGMVAVVYSAPYRFDRAGTYRVQVDLPSLQGRWEGSVRVERASLSFIDGGRLMALVGLVGLFVVFLEWRKRRQEKMP